VEKSSAKISGSPPVVGNLRRAVGITLAFIVLIVFHSIHFPSTLTPVGHALLTVMLFMLVIWVSEAVGYAASSFFLIASFTLLVAFSPESANPSKLVGTGAALGMALSGFSSEAWVLVVCALFLASAIEITGLGQRIGLFILSRMGAKPKRVLFGVLLMAFILTVFIPAQAANAALMTAVSIGIIEAFGLDLKSNLSKGMLLLVAFGTGIAGMGILTSGAPPIQTAMYISQATKHDITWLQWAIYGMPFALTLGAVLYFLVLYFFPVGKDELEGGVAVVQEQSAKLGPITTREVKLLIIMLVTIFLWATGKVLHPLTPSTVAVLAVVAIFFPGLGVATWKQLAGKVNWGTLMLFGAAISLGIWLLKSGAAAWVAKNTIITLGVDKWPLLLMIAAGGLFFAIFALAFSARSAAVAALVPTAIGFAQSLNIPGVSVWGMTLIFYYTIQFSVIIPVNTPMSMVAYSTDTFSSDEMMKVGIPLVIIAILIMVIFSATYWHWMGLV
jgi:solute carrier family 13 (sodium-dependent dicarboxylate transporter), member 2/3/5